jgi:hypothetical protein
MDKRTQDWVTTILYASFAGIAVMLNYFQVQIIAGVPAAVAPVILIALGLVSQYAGSQRVGESVAEVKRWKGLQILSNIIIALIPIAQIYQPQIIAWLPAAYAPVVIQLFAFASQYSTGKMEQIKIALPTPPTEPKDQNEPVPNEENSA